MDRYYDLTYMNIGKCVIFDTEHGNIAAGENFKKTRKVDIQALDKVLSDIGYETAQIKKKSELSEVSLETTLGSDCSFICFVFTPKLDGNQFVVSDGEEVDINDIATIMDVELLRNKPKIFFFLGQEITDNGHWINGSTSDVLKVKASVNDSTLSKGSTFVQIFTKVLQQEQTRSTITEMLNKVILAMNCLSTNQIIENGGETSSGFKVPCFVSTLQKAFVPNKAMNETWEEGRFEIVSEMDIHRVTCMELMQFARETGVSLKERNVESTADVTISISDLLFVLDESTGCYGITNEKRCIIVNDTGCSKSWCIERTQSTIKDNMDKLQFTTTKYGGQMNHDKLMINLSDVALTFSRNISCLFCIILINMESGYEKRIEEIINLLGNNCALLDRPKIFVIQRYKSSSHEVSLDSLSLENLDLLIPAVNQISTGADILKIEARVADSDADECFVEAFCKSYCNYAEKLPILDIINKMYTDDDKLWQKYSPLVVSTLRKHFILKTLPVKEYSRFDNSADCAARKFEIQEKKLSKQLKDTLHSDSIIFGYKSILDERNKRIEIVKDLRRDETSQNHILVVAIDFGTSYSGYAFATLHDYMSHEKDPSIMPTISTHKWNSGHQGLISYKAPTSILLNEERKFIAFGYEAENRYSDMPEEEISKYFFIERFKMALHEDYIKDKEIKLLEKCIVEKMIADGTLSPSTSFFKEKGPQVFSSPFMLKDIQGREVSAEDVFTMSIKALIDEFKKNEKGEGLRCLRDGDIRWVLSLPAMWSERSKQFMRRCTEKAGIKGKDLLIALEPECASVYCHHAKDTSSKIDEKRRYIVVDLGGGTADISVHEKIAGNKLKEIHRSTGKDCGGTTIDKAFYDFFRKFFGEQAVDRFESEYPDEKFNLLRAFEVKKRYISEHTGEEVKLAIPVGALLKIFGKKELKDLRNCLPDSPFKDQVRFSTDKLVMKKDLFEEFFTPAIESVMQLLENLFQKKNIDEIENVIMVGGFSECKLLIKEIRSKFPTKTFIVPDDCGLAVLKGAVLYGLNPSYIARRILRQSYGVEASVIYDPRVHDSEHKFTFNGTNYCKKVFEMLIQKDSDVANDFTIVKSFRTFRPFQENLIIEIYASDEVNVRYTDDDSCYRLGKLEVAIAFPNEETNWIDVKFAFGGTEIKVVAVDRDTQQSHTTNIELFME